MRYLPYGEERWNNGASVTDFGFTAQRRDSYIKLYDYGARWYDPLTGRFVSPDTIIPNPAESQSFNRYAYVNNNPLRYTDPTGHLGRDEIQDYFDVDSWEEVLDVFEEGGELEGRWGWLEVLREAELGDPVEILDERFKNDPREPLPTLFKGILQEIDGELYIQHYQQEAAIISAKTAGLLGTHFEVNDNEFWIPAGAKYLTPRYDFGRVDKVNLTWDIASATVSFFALDEVVQGIRYGTQIGRAAQNTSGVMSGTGAIKNLVVDENLGSAALSAAGLFGGPVGLSASLVSVFNDFDEGRYYEPH